MGRFFCALLIGALMAWGVASWQPPAQEPVQSVFFSLLFPQLVPEFEWSEALSEEGEVLLMPADQLRWKAVLL